MILKIMMYHAFNIPETQMACTQRILSKIYHTSLFNNIKSQSKRKYSEMLGNSVANKGKQFHSDHNFTEGLKGKKSYKQTKS